jgi:predicted transcriptional regulator
MSDERPQNHSRPPRDLTDPKAMRAVAHPTRLALLEALAVREPLTATEASEIVGESPTNCAFHLRTLAKYGFVEEAEGGAGRRRPWRRKHIGFRLDANAEGAADPEARLAADVLVEVLEENWIRRIRRATARRASVPREWRKATGSSSSVLFMTPQEGERLQDDLIALLMRYEDRMQDPSLRPEGSVPVEMITFTHLLDTVRPEGA